MTWDRDLLDAINPDAPVIGLDVLMVLISLLGYMVPYALIGFAIVRPGRRADAFLFWSTILATEVVVAVLKIAIDRPRPDDVRLLLSLTESPSMPSGHAARAFAGAFVLWGLGNAWRLALFTFALLTLVSRVYVGAHYPSDVLVGAFVGACVGLAGFSVLRWIRSELAKPPQDRSRLLERAHEVGVYGQRIDYLYTLRLLGELTTEQTRRLGRALRLWGQLRLLVPPFMILFGIALYALLFPQHFGPSASCLGAYFVPIVGLEVGIPLCIALGIPAWLIVTAIVYLDLWLSLFFILNFDFLHKVPRLGAWLLRHEERGLHLAARHPWLFRLEFLGVALVTFFPLPGFGVTIGVIVGRLIGMPRIPVWGAVMLGTLARVSLYVYSLAGLFHLLT